MTVGGQIKAKPATVNKEMESMLEEQDQRLACCICREGYKFYPNKVNKHKLVYVQRFNRLTAYYCFISQNFCILFVIKIIFFLSFIKVLGIYTFTMRCVLDEFENKPKRSQVCIIKKGFPWQSKPNREKPRSEN